MKYTWKALVCCISKTVLIAFIALVSLTGVIVLGEMLPADEPPEWIYVLAKVLMVLVLSAALVLVGVVICQENLPVCQVAVDTKRNPWYWLPWIGEPLPSREWKTCAECGGQRRETEDEYRERLGLEPLAKEKR